MHAADWTVKGFDLCQGGKRTSNYRIELENGKYLLLRVYPEKGDVSDKEAEVYAQLQGRVPVPIVFGKGTTRFGHGYLLMSYLGGQPLAEKIREGAEISEILMTHVGQCLGRIHDRTYESEGLLDEDLNLTPGLPPILDWYAHFLQGRPGRKLGEAWSARIDELVCASKEDLKRMTSEFVLTHGDFRPANLLVSGDSVTGVLDWEFVLSAPRYFDMGQWVREEEWLSGEMKAAFSKGYEEAAGVALPDDWERLARLMDIATMMSFLDRCEEVTDLDLSMIKRIQVNVEWIAEY